MGIRRINRLRIGRCLRRREVLGQRELLVLRGRRGRLVCRECRELMELRERLELREQQVRLGWFIKVFMHRRPTTRWVMWCCMEGRVMRR